MFRGSTEFCFKETLPQLIRMDGILLPSELCLSVPAVPKKMLQKALWYVENQKTHIHAFQAERHGAVSYYVMRKDNALGLKKISTRAIDMYERALFQGEMDPRVKDLDHLLEVCSSFHRIDEEDEDWPVLDCEFNPARHDCIGCKCFKSYGICSHVAALNHILKRINIQRELMTIGHKASKKAGGNVKRPPPALQRAPAREIDSSDDEEERMLLQGEQGK